MACSSMEDLIIKIENKGVLDKQTARIQNIFQVEISYGTTSDLDGNQWVNIKGDIKDRKEAKDYIKALCTPGEQLEFAFPPGMGPVLSDPDIHLKLERESCAVIIYSEKDTMQVLGSDSLSVTLALSAVEDIINNYHQCDQHSGQKSPSTGLASKRLDQELRRLSSGRHSYELNEEDLGLQQMNDAIKRTFLHALKDTSVAEEPGPGALLPPEVFVSPKRIQTGVEPPKQTDRTGVTLLGPSAFQRSAAVERQSRAPTDSTAHAFFNAYGGASSQSTSFPVLTAEQVSQIEKGYQSNEVISQSKVQPVHVTLESPTPVSAKHSETARAITLFSDNNVRKSASGTPWEPMENQEGHRDITAMDFISAEDLETRQKEEHKDLLFASGIQDNFSEKEIDRVFKEKGTAMSVKAFMQVLKSNRGAVPKRQSPNDRYIGKSNNFPKAPTDVNTNPALKPTALLNAEQLGQYYDKRLEDDQTEYNCTRDELKANNFQRQQILRDVINRNSPQFGNRSESPIKIDDAQVEDEVIDVEVSEDEIEVTTDNWSKVKKKRKHSAKKEPRNTRMSPAEDIASQANPAAKLFDKSHQSTKAKQSSATNQRQFQAVRRSPSPRNTPDQRYRHRTNSPQYSQASAANQYSQAGAQQHIPGLPAPTIPLRTNLRYIVIDGSNVAMTHGNHSCFSCRGIEIAVNWFLRRGHTEITAFVPQWRSRTVQNDRVPIRDQHLLEELRKKGYLTFTPARKIPGGANIVCYDDRFIVGLANQTDGRMLSNDNYRDLWDEKHEWRSTIKDSLLMYNFVADILMIPDDPLGRNGPNLDNFLKKTPTLTTNRLSVHPNVNPVQYQQHNQTQQQQNNMTWQQRTRVNQATAQQALLPTPGALLPTPMLPAQHQAQQQHKQRHGPVKPAKFHSRQDTAPMRNVHETMQLRKKLCEIFEPEEVETILGNHPAETDIEKMSSYVLDAQSK